MAKHWNPDCTTDPCDCPGEVRPQTRRELNGVDWNPDEEVELCPMAPYAVEEPVQMELPWTEEQRQDEDSLAARQDDCAHEWQPRGFTHWGQSYECDLCGGVTP